MDHGEESCHVGWRYDDSVDGPHRFGIKVGDNKDTVFDNGPREHAVYGRVSVPLAGRVASPLAVKYNCGIGVTFLDGLPGSGGAHEKDG